MVNALPIQIFLLETRLQETGIKVVEIVGHTKARVKRHISNHKSSIKPPSLLSLPL